MKQPSDSSVIICSIVRDSESGLRKNIPAIQKLCGHFKDYHVFVYENDSVDSTKDLLSAWSDSDPEHVVVSLNTTTKTKTIPTKKECGTVNPFFSRRRISKMADLRNLYMDYISEKGLSADYLIVVDLDVAQVYPDAVLSSFESRTDWDSVSAFGYSISPRLRRRYHDTFALVLWGDETPQTEKKMVQNANHLGKLSPKDNWVRVMSAFGGLTIYRFEAVEGLRYSVLDNPDPRVEVCCEHYSIHTQMKERGYDSFWINPAMVLHYQKLSPSIVINSLLRRLGLK